MGNLEKNREIDIKQVENYFNTSASIHKNMNAVLDVSQSKEASHSNIYRDYFTKKYLLKNVAPEKTDTILDFGCGVGRVTFYFAPYAGKVTGIDNSEKMLEVAMAEKGSFENLTFTLLSGSILPFTENSFNKIFSHWVLQHIPDENLIEYLNEFYRILPIGGRIYFFEQTMSDSKSSEKHIYRKTEDYIRLIESINGFKKISVKPVMYVPSRGMSLWNKKIFFGNILLPFFGLIDELTMNYKKQHVKYYTTAFIYEKCN